MNNEEHNNANAEINFKTSVIRVVYKLRVLGHFASHLGYFWT